MAVIFGFLYGSIFCFEHHDIESLMMPVYNLIGVKTPYILFVSQSNIMQVFLIVIFLGMAINLTGMLLNIINGIVKKRIVNVLFSATGLAGFLLLLSGAIFALSFALPGFFDMKFTLSPVMQIALFSVTALCLALIFFKDPLVNVIKKHKPVFHGGIVMGLFFCFVELFEAVLTTISNNLSFIRLGAFALSHAILSSTILLFVDMAGGPKTVLGIIVLIFGNAVIIGLEGMIVMIQTIRLEYYEFFSKFFNEFGKQFVPFKIDKRKIGVQE
jgi:V/A-type H+-transporting ATPase subunit I